MMFTDPAVFRRKELLAQGLTRGHIDHMVASGRWQKIHRGIYVDTESVDVAKSMMRAHLLSCGPDAVLSHATAADLHAFDSTVPRKSATTVTTNRTCGVRTNNDLIVVRTLEKSGPIWGC
jgi:Transcriptional regulator, AbiEi antitoxin